jgi:hypothetical protein
MLASVCRREIENISSMVDGARLYLRCLIQGHVPNLVALTLLEVVALSATGLEEVGALLGVTLDMMLV